VLLAACGHGAPAPAPSSPAADATAAPSSVPLALAQSEVDELVRSSRAGDRRAFDAGVSTRDPSFADRARLLFTNLSTLPLDELTLRLQPGAQLLSGTRRQLLGAGAWRQPAVLVWRLTGEPAPAEHTVWLTFTTEGGRPLLAGTSDAPAGSAVPQPIWWTGPVTAAVDGSTTVVVGAGQSARSWLRRSRTAVATVSGAVTSAADDRWSGGVTVEVPASRRDFEAVLGAEESTYAAIAAVTLAEGPAGSAAVRVVVNPDVSRTLAPVGIAVVLAHETVHVATRSVDSPAPTWAVEGFADQVALHAHPEAAAGAAEPLLREVRRSGAPRRLPADERFRAGEPELAVSYAASWSACRYVAETYSPAALQQLYTALDAGRPLDEAAPDTLGISSAALTAGWQRYLRRLARG